MSVTCDNSYIEKQTAFLSVSAPVRVFVADSSAIYSQLLAECIARDSLIEICGFSSDAVEIARLLRPFSADVLVISAVIEEDPNGGLSLLRRLRTEFPSLKAIVLLDSSKPEMILNAFRCGASGIFCRSTPLDQLLKCIAAVHSGQIWASSRELGYVIAALASAPPCQLESNRQALLTRREREVVKHLVEGRTNREIAQTLAISQHTVKNYIFTIFEKLGVSNRVELAYQILSAP